MTVTNSLNNSFVFKWLELFRSRLFRAVELSPLWGGLQPVCEQQQPVCEQQQLVWEKQDVYEEQQPVNHDHTLRGQQQMCEEYRTMWVQLRSGGLTTRYGVYAMVCWMSR